MSYEDCTQEARAPLKKLLRYTDNGAKIALVKRTTNRDLILEASRPCPLLGKRECIRLKIRQYLARIFFKLFKRALYQRLTSKCREMAFFPKNPMMNSFAG